MIHKFNFKKKALVIILGFSLLFITNFLIPTSTVYAVCPICTVAVGAGLGLSRYLGIDDTISGIWVGGLILSSSFWLIDWIEKKRKKILNTNYQLLTTISMYALVLIPLWYGKIIGDPFNTILVGIDKLIFGTTLGSLTFLLGMWVDKKVRKIKGKQLFIYQKVVFPIASLVIASLLIYYWGGYLY